MTVLLTKRGRVPVRSAKSWPGAGIHGAAAASFDMPTRHAIDLIGGPATFEALYRDQVWVFVVVNKLSRGIARLPLKTYVGAGDRRERVRDHPLAQLLARPYPGGSRFKLTEAIVGNLAMYANALVVKWRPGPGRPPSELWPLPWKHVTPIPGTTRPIDGYRYTGPAGERTFLPEDVIHLEWWSPTGAGVSPLEPLARTLALEDGAIRYATSSFTNGARPSGALVAAGRLRPNQREELRSEIKAIHEGPDNAFRVALLDGGLEWRPFAHTAQESELISHRRLNREEVAAAFDLPPPIIHILDRSTFSNITEQHRMLYMDTIQPWTGMLEETFAAQLIEGESAFAGTFVEYDFGEVLRGDLTERSAAYQRFLQSGVYTPNELRRMENMPDVPGGDVLLLPLNMQQVGKDAPPAEAQLRSLLEAARVLLSSGEIEDPPPPPARPAPPPET